MDERKVRVGIIGAGDFAEVCHIPGIQAHPQGEVVALCARNRERAAALAARRGVPDIYTDYHDLLAREDIDAVTIAGPDSLHAPAALAALAAGKHVFCEKPLAMNAAEAERMVEACAQADRIGMVSYTFRYGHALRGLRRLLSEGAIGTPCHVLMQVHWGQIGHPGPTLTPSYDLSTLSSSGAWADAATHLFDALAYVLAPPHAVCAQMMIVRREPGTAQPDTIDIATCLARIDVPAPAVGYVASFADREPGAIQAVLLANRLDRGPDEIQVVGTRGMAVITLTRGEHESLRILRPDQADWEEVALPTDAYTDQPRALIRMMGAFVDAVLRGRLDAEHDPSFAAGLRAQYAIDAALVSARGGHWQEVRGQ